MTEADYVPILNPTKVLPVRKRPWNETNRPPRSVEMDKVLFSAAKSIDKNLKKNKDEHNPFTAKILFGKMIRKQSDTKRRVPHQD